ncbi:MAG: class I SAM-dependent methyltransferase [Oscillospiraceae bacterium]|nr:class I SAM-dependent methyltransferase [Oscillospiraceae bacterium]
MAKEETYDTEFYSFVNKTSRKKEITAIVKIVHGFIGDVDRVIDFGCGLGQWLSVFKEFGASKVTGVDGDYVDRNRLYINADEFMPYDLSNFIDLNQKYDLAISIETAEHLTKDKAKTFVDTLCAHSDVILFAAAIPYQGGTYHANEQFPSYWAKLFSQNGYVCLDCIRPEIWYNDKIEIWHKQNIMLYVKSGSELFGKLCPPSLFSRFPTPLDIIHPELQLRRINEFWINEDFHSVGNMLKVLRIIVSKLISAPFKALRKKG